MQGESAERELLTAAKAMQQGLISAEDLAKVTAAWTAGGKGSLLPYLEDLSGIDEMDRQRLRSLFAEHNDSLVGQIAESLDDSLFDKLNQALADVPDNDLKASVVHWRDVVARRAAEPVSEDDRFRIVAAHAEGGLGEVLLAQDRQLNRDVALKRIREKWAGNEQARIRFRQEAEITGRLEHPGVVPVYALGTRADGQIYYAMRFIRGQCLEETTALFHDGIGSHPDGFRSADFRNLLRRFVDVCNTIGYAHSRGIIHRDLKPANIMLGKYGETLVVDWGLAKQVGVEETEISLDAESLILSASGSGSAPTQFGSAVGTPQYMSPEQAGGRPDRMGPLTDVFGLGATLYHMLTNRPPQSQDSVDRILERVEHGDFDRPTDVVPDLPQPLEAICLKAMAVRPSDRYSSPTALANDIELWLADEPISVHSDSVTVKAARWVRKNQTIAATTAVTLLLLIVAAVAGGLAWNEFEHQRFAFEQADLKSKAEAHERREVQYAQMVSSLETTDLLVENQLQQGNFLAAVSVLNKEIAALQGEMSFTNERRELQTRAQRLNAIVRFYELAADAQAHNFQAQDEAEIIATVKALDLLGVWNQADWWNHLPDDDLNAEQQFQLREAVYRDLVLLASTYTKLTVIRTLKNFGSKVPETFSGRLDAVFSRDGREEARATLAICDMASRYRYAECLRWYHSVAGFRLLQSVLVPVRRLKAPRSSVDAYELGVMLLTKALVEDFPFRGYRGVEDDFMNAQETFSYASQLAPDHYFTHLVLATTEYLIGERAAAAGDPEAWLHYEMSQQSFGRCMALDPELPFAFGDVATVCLREREVIANSKELSAEDIQRKQDELLERCRRHALTAVRKTPGSAWVYWHYGHTLAAVDRMDEAMEAYRRAVTMSYRFGDDTNVSIIDVDRIRGRARLIEETQKRIDAGDECSIYHAVIAAAYLLTQEFDKARPYAKAAAELQPVDPLAWSVQGILALHDQDNDAAYQLFRKAESRSAESFWAVLGQGLCLEEQNKHDEALQRFRRAEVVAQTDYHRADSLLGQCRAFIRMGRFEDAAIAVHKARDAYPACHLEQISQLANQQAATPVVNRLLDLRHISTRDLMNNRQILDTRDVHIANADFSLPFGRCWQNPADPAWLVKGGGRSTAQVKDVEGVTALHVSSIAGDAAFRASSQQTITVDHDSDYELVISVLANSAVPGSLRFYVVGEGKPADKPVVEVDAATTGWTTLKGRFRSPTLRRNKGLMPMTFIMESTTAADVLVDHISIQKVASESESDFPADEAL